MRLINKEKTLAISASKAGMDENTARKYLRHEKLPSQMKKPHIWQTRIDPFSEIWDEAKGLLGNNSGLEAKSLFEYFQRIDPGKFSDGQLRTFQRRVKRWRALEGPGREVFFPQHHFPGVLCESDFTWMNSLGVTIQNLTYEFTQRYRGLLRHYGVTGERIRAGEAHENGDIEQSHHRFKKALDQALMLRGSRDFENREAYEIFLRKLFTQLNAGRKERFEEDVRVLRRLPVRRLDDFRWLEARVSPSSTIRVAKNTYSLHSRLKGETVRVKLYAEHFEVYYAQKKIDRIPRLRGERQHYIQYRHIIDSLVRKPGAFENYRYKEDLFPTIRFRMAYDYLCERRPARANKEYVEILYLAAMISESGVDKALHMLFEKEEVITAKAVENHLDSGDDLTIHRDVHIDPVNPGNYDMLLNINLRREMTRGE